VRGSHGGGGSLTDLPVVFSRDAKYFFVCSCTAVRVFVCDTAQLLTTLQHEQTVTGCAVNPTNAFQVWAPFRVLFPPLSCGLPSIPAASHTRAAQPLACSPAVCGGACTRKKTYGQPTTCVAQLSLALCLIIRSSSPRLSMASCGRGSTKRRCCCGKSTSASPSFPQRWPRVVCPHRCGALVFVGGGVCSLQCWCSGARAWCHRPRRGPADPWHPV
jgi:hypothetical protein